MKITSKIICDESTTGCDVCHFVEIYVGKLKFVSDVTTYKKAKIIQREIVKRLNWEEKKLLTKEFLEDMQKIEYNIRDDSYNV